MKCLTVLLGLVLAVVASPARAGNDNDEWNDFTPDKVRAMITDDERRCEEAKAKLDKSTDETERKSLWSSLNYEKSRLGEHKQMLPIVEKNAEVRKALEQRANLALNTDFDGIVDKFIDAYKIRIRTAEYVKKGLIELSEKDAPLSSVLDTIARQSDAKWKVANGGILLSPLHIPEDAWKHDIEKKLSKKVTFEFVDTSLDEAVSFLRQVSGSTIILSPQLQVSKTINLHVTDLPLKDALNWIFRLSGAEFTLLDRVIYVYPAPKNGSVVTAPRDITAEQIAKAKASGQDWQLDLLKKLETRVTFEFVESSFEDAIGFLNSLTKANIVIDPTSQEKLGKASLTLHMMDMPIATSISWICRLWGAEWELKDKAIFIHCVPDQPSEEKPAQPGESKSAENGKLHVKLPNGGEIEADQSILNSNPGIAGAILEQCIDPARDGLLVFHLEKSAAADALEKLRPLASKVASKTALEYDERTQLLLVTGGEPADLRRVATLIRELGIATRAAPTKSPTSAAKP